MTDKNTEKLIVKSLFGDLVELTVDSVIDGLKHADEKAGEYGLSEQEQHQLRVLVMAAIITELEHIWKAKF